MYKLFVYIRMRHLWGFPFEHVLLWFFGLLRLKAWCSRVQGAAVGICADALILSGFGGFM